MQKIILQPCGNKLAQEHFQETIINGVSLDILEQYLEDEIMIKLKNIYKDKKIEVRGVVPGVNNMSKGKYDKTNVNDLVMFSASGNIIYIGSICYKTHNQGLANALRGQDESGQTRENIYFLIDGKEELLPVVEIAKLVGYQENYVVQGFSVVDEEKSEVVLEKYGNLENALSEVDSEYSKPTVGDIDYVKTESKSIKTPEEAMVLINKISKDIENKPPREKQRIIRAIVRDSKLSKLVKEKVGYICEICGKEPFETTNGGLYAEAHHLKELGFGGFDHPDNMICVCPDCHMKIHHAKKEVKELLLGKLP